MCPPQARWRPTKFKNRREQTATILNQNTPRGEFVQEETHPFPAVSRCDLSEHGVVAQNRHIGRVSQFGVVCRGAKVDLAGAGSERVQ